MNRPSRTRRLTVFAAAGVLLASAAAAEITVQEAILRAKPAVALVVAEVAAEVTLSCGGGPARTVTPPPFRETGTGWFIDGRGYLITNAHVVQPAHTPPRWMVNSFAKRAVESTCVPAMLQRMGVAPGQRPDVEEQVKRQALDSALPTIRVKLDPAVSVVLSNGTRVKAEVKKYSPPLSVGEGEGKMSGRDLALLRIPGQDFPVLPVADSRGVKIGDPVRILGFPGVVLSHELLNQSATAEASVTNGAVSGFKQDIANQPVIQTDAPAAWGNSGGPAVNQRGEVVGVLVFVSLAPGPEGGIVQGFNFIIPSQAVQEFIQGTEVKANAASSFNKAWWAGLEAQFDGNYKRAEREFEAANKLIPNLPDVKRMLAEAQDKIKNPPPRPFPWAWATLGVTLVSLGGYGAMWGRRWLKNRYRVGPSAVVRLLEEGKNPLILDVRKESAFETSPLKIPGAFRLSPEDLDAGKFDRDVERERVVVAYCT